jgi:polyferredoxin
MRTGGPRWLYLRFWVQAAATVIANNGLLRATKTICWPGLNCWACPTAAFACPIGALQMSMGAWQAKVADHGLVAALLFLPWYVLGGLLLAGGLGGRLVCGWICPFGWVQDLLGRISPRKLRPPRWLSYSRYAILVGLVFIVAYWTGQPWFCKLCPQGFLEGGIPQPALDPALRAGIGWLWYTKLAIFLAVVAASIFMLRPFCAMGCPLGAIYAMMQPYSLYRTVFLRDKCTNCEWCVRTCPQGLDPRADIDGALCVSCLECRKCPARAIVSTSAWRAADLVEAYRRQHTDDDR